MLVFVEFCLLARVVLCDTPLHGREIEYERLMQNNGSAVSEIVFLDRQTNSPERQTIPKSMEMVLEKQRYEWLTVRVGEDGSIKEEG
jgi:hypothetical protein